MTGGTPAGEAAQHTAPEAEGAARPAARRRSRRATAEATAPSASGTPTSDAGPTSEAEQAAEPATASKAPARRRTRATKAASAPAEPVADEPTPESAAPEAAPAAGDDAAPAAPSARRRSTRAKAKPADAAPESAPSETPAPEQAPAADAAATDAPSGGAPVARTGRSGGRRRGGAKASAGAEDAAVTVDTTPPAEPVAAAEQPESTSSRVGGRQRLATTALLFQAPEPTATRPRRRRAEAPAGPPRHADEVPDAVATEPDAEELEDALTEADETQLADAEQTEAEQADTDLTETEQSDEAGDETESGDETEAAEGGRRRRRRGGRGRRGRSGERSSAERGTTDAGEGADDAEPGDEDRAAADDSGADEDAEGGEAGEGEGSSSSRRRRRRRRSRGEGGGEEQAEARPRARARTDEVTALKGSTRLEAKRQRRREGRDAGRRRAVITEAEFLARRESVERSMVVREQAGRVQIAILEDGVLVEHYVSRSSQNTQGPMAGNVYLGRVQNVLPSMEAAFVDIGKGRNAVLYAGEVNWDAAGMEGQPRRIEQALKSGDSVLVQVTKEPVGHKGARLTSQITLAGRYLVYVPGGGMTGISRKLPENERARLKKILREIVPDDAGVIVRTAAEGASDEELRLDVQRLQDQWAAIEKKSKTASAPALLQGEPDLAIRVVRDVFNDDFDTLVVQGEEAWDTVWEYVQAMAPDLVGKVSRWQEPGDVFAAHRVDEQLAKGMDRKVWLPSGGSLVIDRTEAMTVIDVNTGKFTGSGGTLEETVTRNNLEAAEEIVRQLRLRDIGGIIVIDFIDMVLESNRDLVLRRLVECLGRDRTKHQVAEVTSLGLVQMTRKRVGQGLFEAFSEPCPHCGGRGYLVHNEPVTRTGGEAPSAPEAAPEPKKSRRKRATAATASPAAPVPVVPVLPEAREAVKATLATIAAAAAHAHEQAAPPSGADDAPAGEVPTDAVLGEAAPAEGSAAEGVVVEAAAERAPVDIVQSDLLDVLASVQAAEAPAAGEGGEDPGEGEDVPGEE
ncbi:ribonuclease E/G [Actinotalea fermentans]|nr:ribonuclease E/G [Actinotalea fermentans]